MNRVRKRLVKKAQSAGLKLRQSYVGASSKAIFEDESLCACPSDEGRDEVIVHDTESCGARCLTQVWRVANSCVQQLSEMELAKELAKRVMGQETEQAVQCAYAGGRVRHQEQGAQALRIQCESRSCGDQSKQPS